MEKILDLYTDYLLSSFGQTSATGLSKLVDDVIKHDTITRFLSSSNFSSKDLWVSVKSLVREHQSEDGVLIFDDSIIDKEFTDENDLISWHWDHSKQRNINVNILCNYLILNYLHFKKSYNPKRKPISKVSIY